MNPDDILLVILSLISWVTIPTLFRILKDPAELLTDARSKRPVKLIISIFSGLTVLALLIGGQFFSALFVAYPLFYAVIFRDRIRSTRLFSNRFALFTIPFFLLWFEEIFAVLDYQGQILPHFIHYIGYYLGYALVIYIFFRRRSYSFAQVMTVGGLFGVLIEGEFMLPQLFITGLSGDAESLLFMVITAPFIFLTHGLYLAGPFLLFYEEISIRPTATKRQVLMLAITLLIIPLLAWGIWSMILSSVGFNPIGVI